MSNIAVLSAVCSASSDVISEFFQGLFTFVQDLDPAFLSFVLRAIMLFGLPTMMCVYAFSKGNRSVPIQILCAIAGVLLAGCLPLEKVVIRNSMLKTFVLAICMVL